MSCAVRGCSGRIATVPVYARQALPTRGAEARRGRGYRGFPQVRAGRLAGACLHQWVTAATHHHPLHGCNWSK